MRAADGCVRTVDAGKCVGCVIIDHILRCDAVRGISCTEGGVEETVLAYGSALGIDFRNGDGSLRGSLPAIISGNACPAVHFGASPLCS